MDVKDKVHDICRKAKQAGEAYAPQAASKKNAVLSAIAEAIQENMQMLISTNAYDINIAKENGMPPQMLDRLMLNETGLTDICNSLRSLAALRDPVGSGEVFTTPNGLEIECKRVPLGTVAMIYEARPNVTVDAAALCLKTGNAVVLRGGKEAAHTNTALVEIMRRCISECGLPPDLIGFVSPELGHAGADALMSARGLIDVLIPRGSKRLIDAVVQKAEVPVIETGAGNCHLYVDEFANLDMAVNVAVNAKCSRPAVCNAIETLLVHRAVAKSFLPRFASATEGYGLEIRGCKDTCRILSSAKSAEQSDFETEYDSYIIAVKIVDSVSEAVKHINKYNTGHSEAIITNNETNAEYFRKYVDAAAVYVNASTRFTDGGEFGFGAEIGISTQKLHTRGPMGLDALTTRKYLIRGNGQVR